MNARVGERVRYTYISENEKKTSVTVDCSIDPHVLHFSFPRNKTPQIILAILARHANTQLCDNTCYEATRSHIKGTAVVGSVSAPSEPSEDENLADVRTDYRPVFPWA